MASITATPLPALGIVKLIIDWTPTYAIDGVFVYRRSITGVLTEVIGSPVFLSGGQAILYDTAAPFDTPVTYRAQVFNPYVLTDSFLRASIVGGWGSPVHGPGPYVVRTGTAANFNTFGSSGQGQILNTVTNAPQIITTPTAWQDVEISTTLKAPTVTTGAIAVSTIYARFTDSLNYYAFSLGWMTDGTVTARIYRRQTSPSTLVLLTSEEVGTYTFDVSYRVRVRVQGSRLEMQVTNNNLITSTIVLADTTHTGPGYVGWGATATTGMTAPLPLSLAFDELVVRHLTNVSMDSTAVTLVAGRDGWIRDPQQPALSVRMDNCASHTLDCLDAERFVFFQGMEAEAYDSATGVFEVVGSDTPVTVAQQRKSKETGLRVVSTTLADIPALKALFSSGRDLLVSLPSDYGWGIESYGTEPVTVGQVQVSRLNARDMRKPERLWSLPVRVTDDDQTYPDRWTGSNNIPVPGATYGDMQATGLTYAQLQTSPIETYQQWSQGVYG